jgi:hypothetical protein
LLSRVKQNELCLPFLKIIRLVNVVVRPSAQGSVELPQPFAKLKMVQAFKRGLVSFTRLALMQVDMKVSFTFLLNLQ